MASAARAAVGSNLTPRPSRGTTQGAVGWKIVDCLSQLGPNELKFLLTIMRLRFLTPRHFVPPGTFPGIRLSRRSVCVCKAGSWLSGSTDLCPSERARSMQGLIRLTDGDNDCPRKKERESVQKTQKKEGK